MQPLFLEVKESLTREEDWKNKFEAQVNKLHVHGEECATCARYDVGRVG